MSIDVDRHDTVIQLIDKINKSFGLDKSKYKGYSELFGCANMGFVCIYWDADMSIWRYFWFDDCVDWYNFLEY